METILVCGVAWLILAVVSALFIAPRLHASAQSLPEIEDDHASHQ